MARATVVVPCFNEAARLNQRAFIEFAERHPEIGLLMVDDGSRDETWPRLLELSQRSRGNIRVQRLPQNQGKAEAVRQGLLSALSDQPRYVGYWDADLATALEDIPRLSQVLDEQAACHLVMGARIPLLGHCVSRNPWRRRIGRGFLRLASVALGIPVSDTQCGAKMLRATPQLRAVLAEPFLARWIFDVELLARLVGAHRDSDPQRLIYEFPLDHWREVPGSRLKLRDFAAALLQLAAIYRKYGRVGAKRRRLQKTPALPETSRQAV